MALRLPAELKIWAGNAVFLEAAEGLRSSLRLLGVEATIACGDAACPWAAEVEAVAAPEALWVLVGITLAPGVAPSPRPWPMPRRFVVYQMEQLTSQWLTPSYVDALARAAAVWEFAPAHVARWALVSRRVRYVPLAPPDPAPAPPPRYREAAGGGGADVLFYGCGNDRRVALREAFVAALEPRGFVADFRLGFDLFGDAREDAVRACGVAVNAHFYPEAALETHRINYLLSRGACVLSEPSADPELDALYAGAVHFADYDDLPAAALALLDDDDARAASRARSLALAAKLPSIAADWARKQALLDDFLVDPGRPPAAPREG